jgi:hypothetical protein
VSDLGFMAFFAVPPCHHNRHSLITTKKSQFHLLSDLKDVGVIQ